MIPVNRTARFQDDVQTAIDYYNAEAPHIVRVLIDRVDRAIIHLSNHPGVGTPRYAAVVDMPGLRHWPLRGLPYAMFYIERQTRIDLMRFLHLSRDVPSMMSDER